MIFIPVWQSATKKWRYDFKPTKEVPVYSTGAYRLTFSRVCSVLNNLMSWWPVVCCGVRSIDSQRAMRHLYSVHVSCLYFKTLSVSAAWRSVSDRPPARSWLPTPSVTQRWSWLYLYRQTCRLVRSLWRVTRDGRAYRRHSGEDGYCSWLSSSPTRYNMIRYARRVLRGLKRWLIILI